MMNVKEKFNGIFKKNEEEKLMKNWSLKKKVLVGLGVVGTGIVGAIAYGKSKQEDQIELEQEFEDDEFDYDDESDYLEDLEEEELIEDSESETE